MNEKETDRFAEQLLDATLPRLAGAEPPPGLEARVLARLEARGNFFSPYLKFALAAAALCVVLFVIVRTNGPSSRVRINSSQANSPVAPARVALRAPAVTASLPEKAGPAVQKPKHAVRHSIARLARRDPVLPVFPSPAPLSRQEKLLLRFVQENPAGALNALNSVDSGNKDIEVKALAISPLDPEFEKSVSD